MGVGGQTAAWIMKILSCTMCVKNPRTGIVKVMCMCTTCCVIAFENYLACVTRHAYVPIALRGDGFYESAKLSMSLLIRMAKPPFGMLGILSMYMMMVSTCVITSTTAIMGYLALQMMYPEVDPVVPVVVYILMGFVVAELFMNVFGIAVDTTVQCFFLTQEMELDMQDEKGKWSDDFVPEQLRTFLTTTEGSDTGCLCKLPRRKKAES